MKNKFIKTVCKILIIPYLIIKIIERRKLRRKILEDGDPNYKDTATNIIASMKLARNLHMELISKIHSDRIYDEDKKAKADELSARVNVARRNYNELVNLKNEIDIFLQDKK